MPLPQAHLDFETRSILDLSEVGADNYARHPSTQVMASGLAFDDEPVSVSELGERPSERLIEHVKQGGIVKAWNAPFEWLIWNFAWKREFPNLPPLNIRQMRCVMVKSYAMGLPGKLEKAAPALGLTEEKDMKGNRVMLQLSQPREILSDGTPVWWSPILHEDKYTHMYHYCGQDVEVERKADKRLLDLSEREQELWFLDHRINQRGIAVDVASATAAVEIVLYETSKMNSEIRKITGNQVATCNANKQFADWLNLRGVKTKGVAKSDVADLLEKDDLPQDCRAALTLRQHAAKSSTAKFSSLMGRTSKDGRLRSTLQFYGAAATGRWAGRGFQLHNLPRPKMQEGEILGVFKELSR